jgi:CoA:oxalate CoA-transferase
MSALYERERTGQGQCVEVSLMETVSAFVGSYGLIAETVLNGTPRRQQGNALVFGLGDCVPTRDGGFVVFNCIGSMFKRLCEMIGHTELLDDARFRTDASRYTHRAVLMPYITAWASTLTTDEVVSTAQRFRLPFEKVSTVDELAQDAHAQARGMFPRITQPAMGEIPVARQGMTLSAHERLPLRSAPASGSIWSMSRPIGWGTRPPRCKSCGSRGS